jgi:hypothetical protein
MTPGIRFYRDLDPETAGDLRFMACHERPGAAPCWFGPTRAAVEAQVKAWVALQAAQQTTAQAPVQAVKWWRERQMRRSMVSGQYLRDDAIKAWRPLPEGA